MKRFGRRESHDRVARQIDGDDLVMRHQEPADALGPHRLGTVFLTLLAAAAAWLLGGPHWGDDLVVLVVFVLLCGEGFVLESVYSRFSLSS